MSELEVLLERVKTWPPSRQKDAVQMLEALEQSGTTLYTLTDEEHAAVQIGLDQAERGEFVSDAELEVFWRRNRP